MSSDIPLSKEPVPLMPSNMVEPDMTMNPEKEALLTQILSLQDSLSSSILRVETAKAAHSKLSEENVTMVEYINNLMAATQK